MAHRIWTLNTYKRIKAFMSRPRAPLSLKQACARLAISYTQGRKIVQRCENPHYGRNQRDPGDIYITVNRWKQTTEPCRYGRWTVFNDPCDRGQYHSAGGCYVVYSAGRIVYIGQSKDIYKRMRAHGIDRAQDGSFSTPWGILPDVCVKVKYDRRFGQWLAIEARLIKRLLPGTNGTSKRVSQFVTPNQLIQDQQTA